MGQTWPGGEFDVQVITVGEVSRLLGIPRYRLDYAIETQKIPEPRKTIFGARRYYLQSDVDKIREILKVKEKK